MPVMMNMIQQQQDWQSKLAQQNMGLLKAAPEPESMCGFCETIGKNVSHTPDTVSRILQALNINQLPLVLAKPELNERIGLCAKCEDKIKVVEEAADIRDRLKSLLLSNLNNLSNTCSETDPKLGDGLQVNGLSPYHYPFAQSIQKTNEITPQQQYSSKRKISSVDNWSEMEGCKRKQLKGHNYMTVRTEPIRINGEIQCSNSSDEENLLTVNDAPSISPHSSYDNCTPSPVSPSTALQQRSIPSLQVLSEVTCPRKRRKQARPAKAAGDVVPAVPQRLGPQEHHTTVLPPKSLSPYPPASPFSHKSCSPASYHSVSPFTPQQASLQLPVGNSRSPSASPVGSAVTANAATAVAKRNRLSIEAKIAAAQMVAAQNLANSTSFSTGLPFGYSALYSSNVSDLFSSKQPAQSTSNQAVSQVAAMQSLYNVASAMSNPMVLSRGLHLGGVPPQYQSNSTTTNKSGKAGALLVAKKEPKAATYTLPGSVSSAIEQNATEAGSRKPIEHTLIKTDKRRYCKVCAASMRKANNGRPPQSRFLCEVCTMPMCRSCIEEHRYMIMMKANGVNKSDVKPSASAKLLQAVKMKDKASNDNNPVVLLPSTTKSSSMLASAPPSHSSIIYGCPSTTSLTSSSSNLPTNLPQPLLAGLPVKKLLSPVDMRLPPYQNIAPAPPKHVVLPATDSAPVSQPTADTEPAAVSPLPAATDCKLSNCEAVKAEDAEDCEGRLVIAEEGPSVSADQTDITPEIASKTVAMLMSIDDDESSQGTAATENVSTANTTNQSFQTIPQVSTRDKSTGDNSSLSHSGTVVSHSNGTCASSSIPNIPQEQYVAVL